MWIEMKNPKLKRPKYRLALKKKKKKKKKRGKLWQQFSLKKLT